MPFVTVHRLVVPATVLMIGLRSIVAAPTLEPASSMSAPRAAHSATALADGRVLIAGGFAEGARGTEEAELYDAVTGRFAPLPRMIAPRHSHTATRLADGRVLLVGGYSAGGAVIASAELFDPVLRTFTPTGSLATARAGQVAVPLADGKVLIAGGVGSGWTFLSSAELYDPATGRFTPTGSMTIARESHGAARLRDGRVLVVGGHHGRRESMTLHASAELYDPATGAFRATGSMGTPRHKHDAVLLGDGRVLVTGGADRRDSEGVYRTTELFDPVRGTFTAGPAMHLGRYKHQGTSVLLADGRVLVASGAAQAELYDPARDSFALVPGGARMAGQFAAVAPAGRAGVLITGGYGGGTGPRASAWLYRP